MATYWNLLLSYEEFMHFSSKSGGFCKFFFLKILYMSSSTGLFSITMWWKHVGPMCKRVHPALAFAIQFTNYCMSFYLHLKKKCSLHLPLWGEQFQWHNPSLSFTDLISVTCYTHVNSRFIHSYHPCRHPDIFNSILHSTNSPSKSSATMILQTLWEVVTSSSFTIWHFPTFY